MAHTHHILPSEDQMDAVIKAFSKFHVAFLERYGGVPLADSTDTAIELGQD